MNQSLLLRLTVVLAFLVLIGACTNVSQAQRHISYQGMLTDANSQPLTGLHALTLRIYTADTGGIPLFEETQKVTLSSSGLFNVLIGAIRPLEPLSFVNPTADRYYLGVSVDGMQELSPRSPLTDVTNAFFADTAGYARRASYSDTAQFARAVDPASLNIVPTTVNGIAPNVTLVGSGNTTVNTNGSTITISSTASQGIQEVDALDGTMSVLFAKGPIAYISVTDSGITSAKLISSSVTSAKLASGAVTNSKISSGAVTFDKVASGGAQNGQVLTSDGAGNTLWQSATATGIALPYSGTATSSANLFSLTNTGSGDAGFFQINDATSAANGAIEATTNGLGKAGAFSITNNSNSASALSTMTNGSGASLNATTTGTGNAGTFAVSNSTSGANAVAASTNGTGTAGLFQITNATSAASALQASSASISANAMGIFGWASNTGGTGTGVYGQAEGQGAQGVHGLANNAIGNGFGVYGETKGNGGSGYGVYGLASNVNGGSYGVWGQAEGNSADAIVGLADNTSGSGVGVWGESRGATGVGVYAQADGASGIGMESVVPSPGSGKAVLGINQGSGPGVWGQAAGTGTNSGVFGTNSNAAGYGVQGQSSSSSGVGVLGLVSSTNYAVEGQNLSTSGSGVLGLVTSSGNAVWGQNQGSGIGVLGQSTATSGTTYGVFGAASSSNGSGVGVYGQGAYGVKGLTVFNGGWGVYGSANGGTGYGVYGTNGLSGSGTGTYAEAGGTGNCFIANYTGSTASSTTNNNLALFRIGGTNVARISNTGIGYFDGGTQNSGADVAEALIPVGIRADYEPGDVLVLSAAEPTHVAKCSSAYSNCVAGVYATKPGVLLTSENVNADITDHVPMGVIGIIPTKVSGENGPIAVGDLLVTSATPGHAMKGDPDKLRFGNVLGKAMESFNTGGTGVIKVLVGKY